MFLLLPVMSLTLLPFLNIRDEGFARAEILFPLCGVPEFGISFFRHRKGNGSLFTVHGFEPSLLPFLV